MAHALPVAHPRAKTGITMASPDDIPATPLPLQEALELVKLPAQGEARRFMGTRIAYMPGGDYPESIRKHMSGHKAAFGGHVYAQTALAVARTQRELEDEKGTKPSERLDLHVRNTQPLAGNPNHTP